MSVFRLRLRLGGLHSRAWETEEGRSAKDQFPPALNRRGVSHAIVRPAQFLFGMGDRRIQSRSVSQRYSLR